MSATIAQLSYAPAPAGADIHNTALIIAAHRIARTLVWLAEHGHPVQSFSARLGEMPTIRLEPSRALQRLVDQNRAAYYRVGVEADGRRYRMGQFNSNDVRCVWREWV